MTIKLGLEQFNLLDRECNEYILIAAIIAFLIFIFYWIFQCTQMSRFQASNSFKSVISVLTFLRMHLSRIFQFTYRPGFQAQSSFDSDKSIHRKYKDDEQKTFYEGSNCFKSDKDTYNSLTRYKNNEPLTLVFGSLPKKSLSIGRRSKQSEYDSKPSPRPNREHTHKFQDETEKSDYSLGRFDIRGLYSDKRANLSDINSIKIKENRRIDPKKDYLRPKKYEEEPLKNKNYEKPPTCEVQQENCMNPITYNGQRDMEIEPHANKDLPHNRNGNTDTQFQNINSFPTDSSDKPSFIPNFGGPLPSGENIIEASFELKKELVEYNDKKIKLLERVQESIDLEAQIKRNTWNYNNLINLQNKCINQIDIIFVSNSEDGHNTICATCKNTCHLSCGLPETLQQGANIFIGCTAFQVGTTYKRFRRDGENCMECGHSYRSHLHLRGEFKQIRRVDITIQKEITQTKLSNNERENALRILKAVINRLTQDLNNDSQKINNILKLVRIRMLSKDAIRMIINDVINILDEQMQKIMKDSSQDYKLKIYQRVKQETINLMQQF